ncbi:amidohydrolase family protein [Sporomusa sp.]|uniref:metal-dependent hydrolase family protein n=1 Tax=Sporomusa sp. TaxID=2078658 RepID=UPI002B60D4D5|nr:amidohydrolase family protein [Sporomusa sp.]HWR07503.1 amidohydrolase family protein [Sporomusa sp.]
MSKIIKCGKLFCAIDESVQENAVIIIEDNKITEVRSAEGFLANAGDEVIDLSDKFVLPGLIDTHVHLGFGGKTSLIEVSEPPEMVVIKGVKNAQLDLLAGFTSVRDEGYPTITGCSILRDAINAGIFPGPRIFTSGMYITQTGGHLDFRYPGETLGYNTFKSGNIANGPEEVRAAARLMLKYGADQIKVVVTGGVLSPGNEPGEQNMSVEEIKAAVDVAQMHGKITSAHAHGTAGIKAAAIAGVSVIEHCTLVDEETIQIMVEKGISIAPTFIVLKIISEKGAAAGIPDFAIRKATALVGSHLSNIKKAYDAGIRIVFGTDCGTPLTPHGTQSGEFELMVQAGISPTDTLLSATRYAAELLHWNDKVGTIAPRKFADIIAVDKNPLEEISILNSVAFIMKDGKVYKS